ncbi:MAG: LysM peptidoglycan-binding domain-containing protein [Candidatus Krumholzibacteria bacterium]|nr:LysM peptidoglycan-binding domain-containing protein [Candidatus Krumholzibacteria bacterium]
MPGFEYTVRSGDTLSALARTYRVEGGWQAIWDDDNNEELRDTRSGPDRLMPGDRVYIPGAEGNVAPAPSGGTAEFTAPPPYRIRAEDGTARPPLIILVGGSVRMRAVHDDGADGAWLWATSSSKITLTDETTDTVTITAGDDVSARGLDEAIEVRFTPEGGEPMPSAVTRVTVFSVTFAASSIQGYAFDGMGTDMDDPTPDGETPHISVKKNTRTRVQVTVAGGCSPGNIHFTSDDDTTAEAVLDGVPPMTFTMYIDGKNKTRAETLIHARANTDDGPICASLAVNVYAEKSYTAKVAKVWDSSSASTRLSRPSFSVANTQTALRGFYKQAVATIRLTDYSSDGGALDVNFDPGGAGALVLEAGRVSAGQQLVTDALTGTGKKIVIVKKLAWLFNLGTAAAAGATTITMGSHLSARTMAYLTPREYRFGGPGNYETITITATNTTTRVITLGSALGSAHPITEGIWWPLGGLSGNPAWVQEDTDTEAHVNKVIGHEFGHELLELLDVEKLECVMNFHTGSTDTRIRFKELPRHYDPPGGNENQWDTIDRT